MLYLHIGTKKAGSTTIQALLGSKREVLSEFHQLESFGLGQSRELAMASGTEVGKQFWVENVNRRRRMSASAFDKFHEKFWQRVKREVDENKETEQKDLKYVASSEFVFVEYGVKTEALSRLKSHLDLIFGDYKFILYLRDQVSFIKSLYTQEVKGAERLAVSFEDYMKAAPEFSQHVACYIDYADHLKRWVSVFGKEKFIIRTFDKDNFYGGNLIQDFLTTLEIDVSAKAVDLKVTKNTSPTFGQIRLLRRLNAVRGLPLIGGRQKRLRKLIMSSYVASVTQMKFSSDFDGAIIDYVSSGNRFINENFLQNQKKLPTRH